ncbi:MAG: hypothetical protein WA691_05785 [Thermoplasmata archaeon]
MKTEVDPVLLAMCGSETRLRTLAVLASAYRPMTAYRVAKVGEVPVQKAYEEMRRLSEAGLVAWRGGGWALIDDDVRALLRRRVRFRWDEDWDRARSGKAGKVMADLDRIRSEVRGLDFYDPDNRISRAARQELERDSEKNRILRRYGARVSSRKE